MKILLANYRYFLSGGPERYMFNVISELEKRSHEIVPFSVSYSQNRPSPYAGYFLPPLGSEEEVYFEQHKMNPETLIRTLSRLFYSKEAAKAVHRLITDTRPEVAYVLHYLKKISPSLLLALKKKNLPILVRLSDYAMLCPQNHCIRDKQPCTLCIQGNLFPSIMYKCVKHSLAISILNVMATWFHRYMGYFDMIEIFLTTNRFMYNLMLEAGWPEHKLTCIPTFTDTRTFCPSENHQKSDYICFAGRLDEIKGIEVLLKAFALMKNRKSGLKLKIAGVGDPQFVKKMSLLSNELGINNDIMFTGNLNTLELADLLKHAQMTIVPSLWFENLPNVILESFACGTPVLASDLGSLSMTVKKRITGDLFIPMDSRDLAEKADYYIDHPRLLMDMGKNARLEALLYYSHDVHITQLEKTLKKLI